MAVGIPIVPDASEAAEDHKPYGSPAYSWYVVGVLTLIYTCHAIDRSLPNILLEPIRAEFKLSDSQLGVFAGVAYGLAFSAVIMPMGYISDRVNRRTFLAGVLLLWSLLTALSGFSKNYVMLLAARVGVGAAEAGAAPLSIPMLSDIFPQDRRAFALGLFYASAPIGAFLASALGGYVAAEYGWREAFWVAGIPGVILAVLLLTTIREPRRGGAEAKGVKQNKSPVKIKEAVAHVLNTRGLLSLMGGCALIGLLNITVSAWGSSFFMRVHHLGLKEIGLLIGVGVGLCSTVSPPVAGWLADKLSRRDVRWPLRIVWIAALAAFVLTAIMLFTGNVWLSVACFILADMARVSYTAPTYSVLMAHTEPRMRGTVMSMLQLVTSLIGFGLGPLMTGMLSDRLGGGTSIRYALFVVSFLFIIGAILLMMSSRGLYGGRKGVAARTAGLAEQS
ncbi:MAG: major facilitator superfamily protein [Caulobacteraceae bacterium]|nr:major facilitator superfamily protein [Caulobacteraceae bacterium]